MPPTSLNIKQRLAALSLSQSSSSSYSHDARSPMSPDSRKKIFNTPSWMKKPQQVFSNGARSQSYGEEDKRMVQEVLGKMIFQAGVDFE